MIDSEFNRTFQQFQVLNWRSTSQDRKIVLERINRKCQNLAQLSFQERSACYSILKVVEQHEYKHLFIWVRVFEWIRSKFNANFCTTSALLSRVRLEKRNFETLYLSHRQLAADDLKELQTLNDKNSVRSHLSTFGQCLITPAEKALNTAIKVGRLADVKKLCGQHSPQTLFNQEFRPENPLQIASKTKNKEVIDFLLQLGAKVSTPDIYGNTLLHCLAVQKDLQANYQDFFYRAPLQDILAALKIKNENNDTPLTIALSNQNIPFLNILFDRFKNEEKESFKRILDELLKTSDINQHNLFYVIIRNNKVEWLKLLSITQILEVIKKINHSDIIPVHYLTQHFECFEYLIEKSNENPELKNILFSKIGTELLTQILKKNHLPLLQKIREACPLVFQEWMCSTIRIDSKVFDNPIIYALTFKKLECVREMLYFYDKNLGNIFTDPANGFSSTFPEKVVIEEMGRTLISSCLELHIIQSTSWLGKLKWLEVRSLFGKYLPYFEIPLPATREEFVAAFDKNPAQIKRLLSTKIKYTEYDTQEMPFDSSSIFDLALTKNLLFIFQVLSEKDPVFLDDISTKPTSMKAIIQCQQTSMMRYLSKSSLIGACQDGFKGHNYLNEIITTWPLDKIREFFGILQPTPTSSAAYRLNLFKLFKSVDMKQNNLLHLAVLANNVYIFQFLKAFDERLFKELVFQKNQSMFSPLRLVLEHFEIKNPDKIMLLTIILENYPDFQRWMIQTARDSWSVYKSSTITTLQLMASLRSQRIITDLSNYIISEIEKPGYFPIHLLNFADPLGVNLESILKRVRTDRIISVLVNESQFEKFYKDYPKIMQKILSIKDNRDRTILQQACRHQISHIIRILTDQDIELFTKLIKDQDKHKNTLLHLNSNDQLIVQFHAYAPKLLQECLAMKNEYGYTPLDIAEQCKNEQLVVAILTSEVSYIISKVKDLQQLAGHPLEEIIIEKNRSNLMRQKKALEARIMTLRLEIRIKQKELRTKNLKTPLLLPTEEEILRYKEDLSHRSKSIGCTKIPPADSQIDIGKLKIYFNKIYKKLPDAAIINDDGTKRTKLDIKTNFDNYIDIFVSASHQVGSLQLSSNSKELINNILRHLVNSFMKQEKAIELAKIEGIETKAIEEAFESNLKYVLIDRLGVGFFHCIDRIASECEDMYFEHVIGSVANLEEKTLNNRLYNALLIWRREIFRNIVADIKTIDGERDPHNAATHRYYQGILANKLDLGSSELSQAEENFKVVAIGNPKHSKDKRSREPEIIKTFNEHHSPQEIILRVKRMFDESNPLPSQMLFNWFEQFYTMRENDKANLLLTDGTWNPQAIALFLADPSIKVLQA